MWKSLYRATPFTLPESLNVQTTKLYGNTTEGWGKLALRVSVNFKYVPAFKLFRTTYM